MRFPKHLTLVFLAFWIGGCQVAPTIRAERLEEDFHELLNEGKIIMTDIGEFRVEFKILHARNSDFGYMWQDLPSSPSSASIQVVNSDTTQVFHVSIDPAALEKGLQAALTQEAKWKEEAEQRRRD